MPHHPAKDPRERVADATHNYRLHLGEVMAESAAVQFAGQMRERRRGMAHQYLAAAHIRALTAGMGRADATALVDAMLADIGDDGR